MLYSIYCRKTLRWWRRLIFSSKIWLMKKNFSLLPFINWLIINVGNCLHLLYINVIVYIYTVFFFTRRWSVSLVRPRTTGFSARSMGRTTVASGRPRGSCPSWSPPCECVLQGLLLFPVAGRKQHKSCYSFVSCMCLFLFALCNLCVTIEYLTL